MRRLASVLSAFIVVLIITGVIATPSASAQQSFNLFVGGFAPRGVDGRPNDDVLNRNLDFLVFDIKDFNGPTVGGEWLVALGKNIEAGLGVGFYARTSPAVYLTQTFVNGDEIEQDLKLRTIPFTATVRVLPLGRHAPIQPYIGAGVGVTRYRYSETGQFVDFTDKSIFRDTFVGSGTATGPVILGGVRFPVGAFDIGGEIRYQAAKGDLPAAESFAGSKIDLGGVNYLFTMNFRF